MVKIETTVDAVCEKATRIFKCSKSDIRLTYFAETQTWLLETDLGVFRVNGQPYYAPSIDDLSKQLDIFNENVNENMNEV